MAISKLPPAPLGQPPGHSFWNDWYEKLRKIMEEITYQVTHVFAGIINTDNRLSLGVDTTDYIIIDETTKGLVMKSPSGTYFKLQISDAGVISWTNLGTTKP
jgi:hypothetical protein